MRCIKSPTSFVSKNAIGSFISLIRKSESSEMFTRVEICSNIHRRMKSTDARLATSISCPKSIR